MQPVLLQGLLQHGQGRVQPMLLQGWLHRLQNFCSLPQVASSGGARVMVLQVLLQGLHAYPSCRCASSQGAGNEVRLQRARQCAAAAVEKFSAARFPFSFTWMAVLCIVC